ncbi:DUF3667 domain-containing protein [Mesoterricola sediminis]|uniref:DUF3667 domain-containing protein n=1 Tax=Mesoterricola sediminis TaxID=2927980 RepID=A0AA48H6E8_9BACT|nr:DUF3667 domain-containing protein [Mesoterricola sediminis]BDU78226.1 hypothetical protein METESE_31840 [Mesoterricola sediminis]
MDEGTASLGACLDCGAELHGRYCSACGQRGGPRDLRLLHVLEEMVHDLSHFDGRLLRTLRLMLLRPGQVTAEYLAGRRTRHVPPFRLYVFISFVLFLLLGFAPARKGAPAAHGPAAVRVAEDVPVDADIRVEGIPHAEQLRKGVLWAKEDPRAFREALLHWTSRAMFVLLPTFAALLFLAFFRSRRYFVEHVIFSLHVHAFAFSVFILQRLLDLVPWEPAGSAGSWLILALPVHLGLAMKRVYGGPAWKIVLKGALISAAYLILVLVVLFGALLWVLDHGGH